MNYTLYIMSIFSINDIDIVFNNHLSLSDKLLLKQCNKYYNSFLINDIIKEHHKLFSKCVFNDYSINNIFFFACINGFELLTKYIYSNYKLDNIDYHEILRLCCIYNNLNIVIWLYSINKINKSILVDKYFVWSCKYGKFDLAKWIYSLGVNYNNTQIYGHFIDCCLGNYLEMAKWLQSIYNIDIHHNNDNAFKKSCYNGNLDVAKWLYSFGNIDIHDQYNYVYKFSYINCHMHVFYWLKSIDDNFNINEFKFKWLNLND